MANYQNLMAVINAVIKTNNRREITGQVLQNVLNTMVSSIGENMQLTGFATPTTNPGQPDQNIFYVAKQAGTYSYFNNITLDNGLSFLMWKNGQWSSETIGIPDQEWVRQNFVSIDFFRRIFRVLNSSNAEIFPNDTISAIDNVEALVAFWSDYYVSALGRGSGGGGGGGGGGGDVTWTALADNSDNHQIALSHLTNALTGYATQSWVQSQNYATQLWVQSQSYATQTWVQNQSYASQSWVGQNYISISYFDRLFRAYNGSTLVNHNDTSSTIDNIKAMFGFWTDFYISALGGGGASSVDLRLAQLSDVNVAGVTNGQALVYDSTLGKWIPGTGGLDLTAMWTALGANTNNQINISHLTTALGSYATQSWVTSQGYLTPSAISDMATQTWVNTQISDMATKTWVNTQISDMATQTWVGQNYISISYFDRLFRAYNESTLVSHNDTTTTIDNIKAMFGFWTEYYLSALGNGGSIGSSISLSQLADVSISSPTNGQVLVYDSTLGKWKNGAGGGGGTGDVTWTALAAATNEQINASHLTTALSGYATTTALSGYLPLSGGTLTGTGNVLTIKSSNTNSWIYFKNTVSSTVSNKASVGYYSGLAFIANENTYARIGVNDSGTPQYWSNTSSSTAKTLWHSGNFTPSNYLPLAGGTMTGMLRVEAVIFGYNYHVGGNNVAAFVFDKPNSYNTGIGAHATNDTIWFGACNSDGTWIDSYKQIWDFNGTIKQQGNAVIHAGNIGSQRVTYATTAGSAPASDVYSWAKASTKPSYTFGEIGAGVAIIGDGTNYLLLRNNSSWYSGMYYQTDGDESIVFGNKNTRASWIFANTDPTARASWTTLTPCMQIKNGCVYINKLIENSASGSYNLWVNGSFRAQALVIEQTNEINSYSGALHLNYRVSGNVTACIGGGNMAIGTASASYKLHVAGNIYATGAVTCLSDERFKNVLGDTTLTVEQIAAMPSIRYRWSDNREDTDVHVGSIAQRWQTVLPEVVLRAKDDMGTLSINYGVAALVSSIITARKVVDHEVRIAELEKENKRLKELLKVA